MQQLEGRAAWLSLLVLCAALFSLAASVLNDYLYRWCAIALLVSACAPWRLPPGNALSVSIGLLCAWLFANAVFITPFYSAESIYLPSILLAAFVSVAALPRESQVQLFRAGAALLAALVLLGLLQYYFGLWHFSPTPQRAAGTFLTPNSFATAINIFLLPLVVLYVLAGGSRHVYFLSLWLFAGLVASESRGGMLALLAGLVFVVACAGLQGIRKRRLELLRLLGGWLAVWLAVVAAARLLAPLFQRMDGAGPTLGTWFARHTWDRIELYGTTLQLILERPFGGAGANMFVPLFEAAKSDLVSGYTFHFAHNDYLQAWLEYGVVGLVLLGSLVCLTLGYAWRASRRDSGDPLPLACGAACAACFAHAMVDFPLAIPFILVVIGGYAGALAAHQSKRQHAGNAVGRETVPSGRLLTPAIRYALAVAALAWLGQPALAEIAGDRTVRHLKEGNVERAVYWQSVAQRLEPRNATHYWAEAIIWRDQADALGDKTFASRADALFAECIRANAYEVSCYLERARLHRRHADLLDKAAQPAQILVWTGNAVTLRPYSMPARIEHVRALAYAGRVEDARRLVGSLLGRYPESDTVRRLAAEMELRVPLTGKGAP